MTRDELLQAILASGYQFATDNPFNSLGVILYGNIQSSKTATAASASESSSLNLD